MAGILNFLQQLNAGEGPGLVTDSSGMMLGRSPGINPGAVEMPKRERRSFIDTIGRISDVLARVGGAEALYQPTLDAQQDRARQIDLDALKQQTMQNQVAVGGEELAALQRAKVGMTVKGLQAIQRAGGDINRALPLLGERSGMSPQEIAALGSVLQSDAGALDGLASMFGSEKEFGLQPFYASDAQGNLRAYQIGKDGSIQPIKLAEGETPIDPLKFVDTGNNQVGVGTRSGKPLRILPKGVSPDNANNNRTRIVLAGMRGPGGAAGNKQADPAAVARGAAPIVSALKDAVNRLYQSGGMTDENTGTAGTLAAMARENIPGVERLTNSAGFSAREDLNRLTTVGIPALLPLMGGLTLGGKNIDAAKELETWRNAIASAKDYPSAMRAIKGFEDRIAELTAAQPASAPSAAPRRNTPAPRRPAPARGGNKPSVSNW